MVSESTLVACAGAVVVVVILSLMFRRKQPVALDAEMPRSFPLVDRKELSHDTFRFRFGFPTANHVLGLPTGRHISVRFTDEENKLVSRSYTPVSSNDDLGYVDFVIKVYFAGKPAQFPLGGKMSQHLYNMKIGETIDMMGPKGGLTYNGRGRFAMQVKKDTRNMVAKRVGMVAGGTGITPMLQILRAARKDLDDITEFWLLFANKTEEDILLRQELEEVCCTRCTPATKCPAGSRFHLWYTLDNPPAQNWPYSAGFVTKDMLAERMPPAAPDTIILMCGPPPMIKGIKRPNGDILGGCENYLGRDLGYDANNFYSF